MKSLLSLLISSIMLLMPPCAKAQEENSWTIMYYAVGSNSSEIDLMSDISEMIEGKSADGYEIITLIDRIEGFSNDSTALGENFIDTRLYKLGNGTYERLGGKDLLPQISKTGSFEGNMADAKLLRKFIQYCKVYYPAKQYMLVLRSHGNGMGMCPDAESGSMDRLYPGELQDVLTDAESVDILGLDVCSMAGLENLYEWRPGRKAFSADYVIASAPISGAWAYDQIFKRLQTDATSNPGEGDSYFNGGKEENLDPNTMTALEFSALIFEEIYDSQGWASWGLFDNTKIGSVKQKMDELARLLAKEDKATVYKLIESTLAYSHSPNANAEAAQLAFPYIDPYHFYKQIGKETSISETARLKAMALCSAIDELVVHSYYGAGFLPTSDDFEEGRCGAYQIVPLGNKVYTPTGRPFWAHTNWFSPKDLKNMNDSYGLYDWCLDGGIAGNKRVDNFYEYLDFLFDTSNNSDGGMNRYQW